MFALTFSRFGGPEVLEYREVPDPVPGPGQVLVRTRAVGLNYADLYRRRGTYHLRGEPPYIAGYEAAGVVEWAPDGSSFTPGQRVAFADSPFANAELVAVDQERLVALPDDVSFQQAAALLLQGLTADFLTRDSHALRSGERVLIHAAAGGVGGLLVQLAVAAGARVLGLTSGAGKAQRVRDLGAHATALYSEDWVAAARAFAPGGVDVAYDAVGTTLPRTLDALRIGGHAVFYGMAGGDPPPIDPRRLMDENKTLTGGDLWNVLTTADGRRERAGRLFGALRSGALQVPVTATFPLSRGAEAHTELERGSAGKILLLPG
ncbi:quinone oxidoreductase family protein [Deinococcus koreensis]|uniref:Quinone oxidoreductase n=1 Tax=Deinococcus koreensis TaxID=2054903 RepID=A0A2K3V2U1_9DEIO|nr:quinone oxidoreductase [Deinococcus koreensis]PNY83103.1 quinone oxidoreductase [Deinococcus koreensis]